jgi:hypothetical protein
MDLAEDPRAMVSPMERPESVMMRESSDGGARDRAVSGTAAAGGGGGGPRRVLTRTNSGLFAASISGTPKVTAATLAGATPRDQPIGRNWR